MFSKEKKIIPFVSIVICTYNRKRLLTDCLSSVFQIDYPKSKYEVIVIDGGSTDGTSEIQNQFRDVHFFTEGKFGLAHARNMGASMAKGSIVVYTDDDCIVDSKWIENLLIGFDLFPFVVGVGGIVLPAPSVIVPKKLFVKSALGLYDEGSKMKFVQGIITSNCAFKRSVLEETRFDETLGVTRRGNLILCGEDSDLCESLTRLENKLLYMPQAKVFHQIGRRLKASYIVKHAIHNGVSNVKHLKKMNISRIMMIRLSVPKVFLSFFKIRSDRSFSTCYGILASMSTLITCATGLDTIFG
jgi:glycosyltransferase involved in cell wall biosynthesis